MLTFHLILAICWAGTGILLGWVLSLHRGFFSSPQRHRAVPWGGMEIFVAFLVFFVCRTALMVLLTNSGFFAGIYGSNLGPADSRPGVWASVLAAPLEVALILLALHVISDSRLYQVGISNRHIFRDAMIGAAGWLFVTPLALALLGLAVWGNQLLFDVEPDDHPIKQAVQVATLPIDRYLVILSTVVAAPVVEELIFRGVLQNCLTRRHWGGSFGIVMALTSAFLFRQQQIDQALTNPTFVKVGLAIAPAIFVLAAAPFMFVVQSLLGGWLMDEDSVGAIYGTSLFFAAIHSGIWPSPIPLFFVGLALGYVAYRTQGLVAPITLHALFNAVGTIILFNPQIDKG